ncbi:ABC transporter ATP-binding protein [Desulfurobacterium atlanticum]|uniref:Iron complex transport system ATP-binding protein n=1 Tax=Desulfurobacterium atlanticum TaxID=240169 RepID=A0A238YC26_9BACT|nr:ABC transporter ATP-binding protein [Desulfurobacterium atlanticum]SNR68301.1 iron complex transport system ATP-binding protein [Desulfurobacterium atlanticum]
MLEVINLSFKNIVKNVSFKISEGTITGIIGKNGSGKTTLLKCLSGFLKYSGEIYIDGKNLRNLSVKDRTSVINYLPQEFPATELTPFDILKIESELKNIPEKRVKLILEKYSLVKFKYQPFYTLSGGEKVRVFLARIELINPSIILLDEPSAFLDIETTYTLKKFISIMKKTKKTVLVVSNDLNFILNISDELIGIKEGKIFIYNHNIESFIKLIYNVPAKIEKVNEKLIVF